MMVTVELIVWILKDTITKTRVRSSLAGPIQRVNLKGRQDHARGESSITPKKGGTAALPKAAPPERGEGGMSREGLSFYATLLIWVVLFPSFLLWRAVLLPLLFNFHPIP